METLEEQTPDFENQNRQLIAPRPRRPPHIAHRWVAPGSRRDERIARGLGWFSVALGLAELIAPRQLCRAIGADEHETLVRACGARELAAGFAILSRPQEAAWLWSRVAGDAMDLALLAGPLVRNGRPARGAVVATVAVLGVTAVDLFAAQQMSSRAQNDAAGAAKDDAIRVERSLAINRSPEECYRLWRDFEHLPHFMKHLESVNVTGPDRSHWVAKGPAGTRVEWDAEITDDRPNELLAWRSVEGADVDNRGEVHFLSDGTGRGTVVDVRLRYSPPGSGLGASVAKLFGEEPEVQIAEDLRRYKRLLETGEIPTTEGQPHGSRPLWYRAVGGTNR